MPQIFPRATNVLVRAGLVAGLAGMAAAVWACLTYTRSYGTNVGAAPAQTVPFSHEHHVGVLGIDCRYCHTSVETAAFAGIPPTKTCMNCHSQIWVGSRMLEPVRESYRTGESLRWRRVYNLPGFVYFDHSIHVRKGVGCATCHGRVDTMPLTYPAASLLMEWCLDCHRDPARQVRPREHVFDMHYQPPRDQAALGQKLVREYHIRDPQTLTSCTICHR